MSSPKVTLELDQDVPFIRLVEACAELGYRVSNVDGFTFRVHRPPITWQPAARPQIRIVRSVDRLLGVVPKAST